MQPCEWPRPGALEPIGVTTLQEPAQRLDRVDTRSDRATIARDVDDHLRVSGPIRATQHIGCGDQRVTVFFEPATPTCNFTHISAIVKNQSTEIIISFKITTHPPLPVYPHNFSIEMHVQ